MKNTITPEEHARIKRRRWRQTLGLLITVLVLIGFITVLRAGVGLVANLFDDTAQKQEYEDKLEGMVLFDPMPFDGIENIDDLTLREAAVWGCVYSIQETQGGFENYNTDPETEQLLLPSVEVDAYLAKLLGPGFKLTHRSFDMEDMTVEFDETTQCYKIPVTDNTVQLFPAAYEGLLSLINRCTEAGYDSYIVRQGYRSNEEQTKLFEDAMQRLSSQYSGDILIEQTKKDVNYPGTSEYQSGFAFQMGLYNRDAAIANTLGKFSEDKRGQYFIENCWKDGIVFRLPIDGFPRSDWESKTYKTGISAKLLLFRYVGNAHAAVMRTMDYCLEEYLEFLMAHPHITVYEDGALRYELYRISGAEGDSFTLPVPNPASGYQASLDNLGGVVLAYTYN